MSTLTSPYEDIVAALQMDPWARRAACNNLDALTTLQCHDRLPDGTRDENAARQLCAGCPVRGECLSWVLRLPERDDPDDLWICGGLNVDQRRVARRRIAHKLPAQRSPKPVPATKRCKDCGETRTADEFYREQWGDGLSTDCKPCRKAKRRANSGNQAAPVQRIPTKKPCSICEQVKPLEDFAVDSRARDGHDARCRACRRAQQRTRKGEAA